MSKPLAIDLCCGLGGWTEGLLKEGYDVVGYDIERHEYDGEKYPAQLVLQDILTIDGRKFQGKASLIVASPPCQEFSYMAMPWTRAKQIAKALRGEGDFPEGYRGSRTIAELTALFDACVRIGREAECPVVIENVRGAQPWKGKARANYGSFYLWGDVPALMPTPHKARKFNPDGTNHGTGSWFAIADSKNRGASVERATKNDGGSWFAVAHNTTSGHSRNPVHDAQKTVAHVNRRDGHSHTRHLTNQAEYDAVKQPGLSGPRENGKGDAWFQDGAARHGSKSSARKAASARIAKIPLALSRWVARYYHPEF